MVAGPGMRPAPRPVIDGITVPRPGRTLRLNPLFVSEGGAEHAIRWPSERYEAEYAARATYPSTYAGPDSLDWQGDLDSPEADRVRDRTYVDLPERW